MFGDQSQQEDRLLLPLPTKLRDSVHRLNEFGLGVVFIHDEQRRIVGSVTDGDVRRALVESKSLDSPIEESMKRDFFFFKKNSRSSWPSESRIVIAPIVSGTGRLERFAYRQSSHRMERQTPVVVMAGGFGTRLGKLTESVPKPMVKIQDRPLAEHLVIRALDSGYRQFIFVLHYLSEQIEGHFGDGAKFGAQIDYVIEPEPLGTAGGLKLVRDLVSADQMLVVNSDILSDFDLGELLDFHSSQKATLTIASRSHSLQNPFGVLDVSQGRVLGVREKPTYDSIVAAGAYVVETKMIENIPDGKYDMPQLIETCLKADEEVLEFRIHEAWLDVGRPSDLANADTHLRTLRRGKQ